ncbi:glycosyltransferase family 4 protein [Sulfoacidibacillus thermotolerans]|uniref:Glycosyl transferase family 1 domain-containing protein n=1 Tax=Sulfoacidibacillus thermotolerans TaxID=1765684 RepID=A0A2U3D7D7_SULT2|nr:glycosyltransferase family 4 protein [Sulfoacidibacillus thermotolerans]PWI57163.1 hypothetical protein BM613_09835 [Sulfoacidibacillus thermotolerans]
MSDLKIHLIAPGGAFLPPHPCTSVEIYLYHIWRNLRARVDVSLYGKQTVLRGVQQSVENVRLPHAVGKNYLSEVLRDCDRNLDENSKAAHLFQIDNRPHYVRLLKAAKPAANVLLSLHSLTFLAQNRISPVDARVALQSSDRIIVNSEFIRGELLRRFAFAKDKVHVIYPGVDHHLFHPVFSEAEKRARARLRRELKVRENEIVTLFVGRLIPRKGVDLAIRAVQQARADYGAEVVLWIVGTAPKVAKSYMYRLQQLARKGAIRFLGYQNHEQLADIFRAADIFLCPSQKAEAFGLVNLEAQASGLPVLASDQWGIREAIAADVTGYLLRPYEHSESFARAIAQLASEPSVRAKLGNNGRHRIIKQFTWERVVEQYLQQYMSIATID